MNWREEHRRMLDALDAQLAQEQKKIWRRTWILVGAAAVLFVALTIAAWHWETSCVEWRDIPGKTRCYETVKGWWTCEPAKECVRRK